MKKFVLFLIAAVFALACLGCGEKPQTPAPSGPTEPPGPPVEDIPLDTEHGIADQSLLYGMCYLLEERTYYGSPFSVEDDAATEIRLIANLGSKVVRHWMHFTHLLEDPVTLDEAACADMHAVLAETGKHGILDLGMNHHNFNPGLNSVGKLRRSIIPGSDYIAWLDDYYTSWYTLVSEFPEVEFWEIDNELNNPDFMHDTNGGNFTATQMAEIATDLLFYGTSAVHDANPNAKAVMGGLTERGGIGVETADNPSNAHFLQMIYDNIASGGFGYFYGKESDLDASLDPDDYFDIVSWHPYDHLHNVFDEDFFVEENAKVYQVVLDNEGKHKKVFLSEVGTTELSRGATLYANNIIAMYHAAATRMPYVETICYFKLFDVATESWGGPPQDHGYSRAGLFFDPDPARQYLTIDENDPWHETAVAARNGAPKLAAERYRQAAGGSGSLDLLVGRY